MAIMKDVSYKLIYKYLINIGRSSAASERYFSTLIKIIILLKCEYRKEFNVSCFTSKRGVGKFEFDWEKVAPRLSLSKKLLLTSWAGSGQRQRVSATVADDDRSGNGAADDMARGRKPPNGHSLEL